MAPQGYLLGHKGQLFLPTGRSMPAAFDRETGRLLYYRGRPDAWGDRWGGSWNMLCGGLLFAWRCHVAPDSNVRLGEFPPHKDDGIAAFDAAAGGIRRDFPGKRCAVISGNTLYASGSGKLSAYDLKGWLSGTKLVDCTKWETPHGRAYSLIMAGDTLVVGGRDTVTAVDAKKGQVLWHDNVKGQTRCLAVADRRLLVSTSEGRITCYGPEAVADPPVIASKKDNSARQSDKADSAAAALARRILDQSGKTAGYCLVLGAGDGRLPYHLARRSDLKICCLEPDARKVARARRALDEAGLYGVRATVDHGSLSQQTYPDYFADLIVPGEKSCENLKIWPAREVYRVLRPCGGTIHVDAASPGCNPRLVRRWLAAGKVPQPEIKVTESAVQVVRGRLPGAGNWTHQYADAGRAGCSTDQRVRLPLKLLWFGKPGPARLIARHWKGPAPLCVGGRMYVIGQYSLMAVDAYNGRSLWRRDLPRVGRFPANSKGSNVAADEKSVYLATGRVCLRLDAATGETAQIYQLPAAAANLPDSIARSLAWSYLAVGDLGILGSMGNDREGRYVFLLSKDGKPRWTYAADGVVGNNALAMDQRRVYLIDRTSPDRVARAKKRGQTIADKPVLVALDAATGQLAWRTEEGIGARSELWLAQGVLLATGGGGMTGYAARDGRQLYSRAASMRRFPVIVGDTIYAEPAAYNLRTGEPKLRTDPFTGAETAWTFGRSYGCGSIAAGPNLLMFRSSTLGFYDLAGDSGVHNFGGVRAGCYVNAIAAGGLVLMPPGDASCTCSYCYQTTVALAPVDRHENWSIFYDRLPKTSVKQAALNLGAPGDRRDDDDLLWLGAPRPKTTSGRQDIAVPFRFTFRDGFGPYRRNADLLDVAGTDRPWIYASGLKGLRRAELDLEILDRGISSWPVDRPPAVDGRHTEPCWDGYKAVALERENASVTLRHDEQNLYLAYRRPALSDQTDKVAPWKTAAEGNDAAVWNDDSFELYLSNAPRDRDVPGKQCLHLGVSASGARYDALWTYVTPGLPICKIPRLEVTIDGEVADWAGKGLEVVSLPASGGKLRPPGDFDPSLRIGWNEEGLVLLARVKDNLIREADDGSALWRGDSLEIFLTPKRGTREGYRLVVGTGADPDRPKVRTHFDDFRKATAGEKLTAQVQGKKTPEGYLLEMLLPWKNLKITPATRVEFGMQLFANDDDGNGQQNRFQALWHPAGDPRKDPLAYQTFRLAGEPSRPIEFARGPKPDKSGLFTAVPPYPFPITLPPLGANGEDTKYAGAWSSKVQADRQALAIEMAIPWQTLAEAGLKQRELMVNLNVRGPLRRPPQMSAGFERLMVIPRHMARPRTLSLRLHFAEIEDAKPGQRVFDVKLQGKTVLTDFDIVKAAGGPNRAVIKRFDDVVAAGAVTLELVPKTQQVTASTAPIISGIEVISAATQ